MFPLRISAVALIFSTISFKLWSASSAKIIEQLQVALAAEIGAPEPAEAIHWIAAQQKAMAPRSNPNYTGPRPPIAMREALQELPVPSAQQQPAPNPAQP